MNSPSITFIVEDEDRAKSLFDNLMDNRILFSFSTDGVVANEFSVNTEDLAQSLTDGSISLYPNFKTEEEDV